MIAVFLVAYTHGSRRDRSNQRKLRRSLPHVVRQLCSEHGINVSLDFSGVVQPLILAVAICSVFVLAMAP